MSTPRVKVGLIEYGLGNVHSVSKALTAAGADVVTLSSAAEIAGVDRVVVPGVGAFADGMEKLRARSFVEPLLEHAARERPLLGICLGMQMLFDASEEFGTHAGLGLLRGTVTEMPAAKSPVRKIPQIGWNVVTAAEERLWTGTLLSSVSPGTMFYFVHSFTAQPLEEDRLADADYLGIRVSAAVQRGSVMGTQFHPEKSGPPGLAILSTFLTI